MHDVVEESTAHEAVRGQLIDPPVDYHTEVLGVSRQDPLWVYRVYRGSTGSTGGAE